MRSIWPLLLNGSVGEEPRSERSWHRKGLAILLAGLLSAPSSCWLYQRGRGNFHEVAAGTLYRSRQLSAKEMAYYVKRYRIKSIVNLRGPNPAAAWYQEELKVASRFGVLHYDYGISANHEVDSLTLETIVSVVHAAPKPVLIHCHFGADRTGLVAAAYLYTVEGRTVHQAGQQLSVFYGHFPYLWSRSGAMDRTFLRYTRQYPQQ